MIAYEISSLALISHKIDVYNDFDKISMENEWCWIFVQSSFWVCIKFCNGLVFELLSQRRSESQIMFSVMAFSMLGHLLKHQ